MTPTTVRTVLTLAATASISILAAPRAQEPQTPPKPAAPPAASAAPQTPVPGLAKPLVPVAASTLAASPGRYYGSTVSVTATVEQSFSPSVFAMDQDATKATGRDVLVIAPTMPGVGKVTLNAYITVVGEAMAFDAAEVAKKLKAYTLDLAPDVSARFTGKPVVLATSVVTSAGVDIAKRPPPPMTTDDLVLQKFMTKIGPANTVLRGALDRMNTDIAKQQIAVLGPMLEQTEAFWTTKGKADATQWASGARQDVASLDGLVAAGKWDDATTALATMNQKCTACHGVYRDRLDDGTFRIKISDAR